MASIRLENVTVILTGHLGGRSFTSTALNDVSLTVRDGEVMGIIGPTGCGKTTLLRSIAGLVGLKSGRVLINGKDQQGVAPRDRGLGVVFQDFALYPHLSVWNNLSFYFKLRRREPEAFPKVQEAAGILGVDFHYLLDRSPGALSLGQRQQVAIGRCLVREPRIFLMDEPFANLDAIVRSRARIQVKRLLDRFPVTTVYVTHDQHEACSLCDRIAVMVAGRILQVDTYNNLLAWPAHLQVAEFVTEPGTQFIEGAMMERHFACPALSLPLMPHILVRTTAGQGLVARVRPLALTPASSDHPKVTVGRVDWIESLPFQRLQRVSCQANGATLTFEVAQDWPVRIGDEIPLHIDAQLVDIFDSKSGINLALAAAST